MEKIEITKENGKKIPLTVEHYDDHVLLKGKDNKNIKLYVMDDETYQEYQNAFDKIYKSNENLASKLKRKIAALLE